MPHVGAVVLSRRDSENLAAAGYVCSRVVYVGHNTARVPDAESAFFLHVTDGGLTVGCVAIPGAQLDTILRWLDPTTPLVIDISVT